MEDLLMKAATVIAVALATFSSFPSTAQQQQPTQQQQPVQQQSPMQQQQQMQQPAGTDSQAQARQSAADAQARASASQLKPVSGELMGKLDSKSAKQGDSVVVKTSEDLKFPGGAEIPKGSKLVGHVTNVQARGDGKENSQIAIQFDRAEVKGGQEMAIESVIQSIAPASDAGISMDNGTQGNYGTQSSASAPNAAGTSTTRMNGTDSAMNRPGMAPNSAAQPGTTDQNTTTGVPAPGSIVARNGNVAIRTTSIPGVLLANDINGLPFTNASGMLLGARRDIHLDGGTQMVVAVAAAPQGAGGMSR
jgi:hypothetical protein